ncbi:leucine-rich repeat-containing protein 15-like [Pogonomyrmex barbatus]|uniref:Leucine-rich repeat-containing protein 15-like n=1 Tax=Pogonomyrmex barbatus TaxID=144034 RepID=A0A8N1S7Y3_9HYME|nr:leucine-rich repeat-containing protein 15-like [Pogonomyrmex barbatus]XP_025074930.1 leucine-rich repeat-containing protein 15-like [Pogonomyrmex barbatus]
MRSRLRGMYRLASVSRIRQSVFQGLNKLKQLKLNSNRITNVSRALLCDLVGLGRLFLMQNEISTLESGMFRDLVQLELLRLDENKLSHIVAGTFAGLSNLKEMSLSDNEIHTVDDDAFSDLVKLEYLYFFGNNSTEIDKEISDLPLNVTSYYRKSSYHRKYLSVYILV